MESVLKNANKARIVLDPYPHIVIENALSEELYAKLSSTFPDQSEFNIAHEKHKANSYYRISASEALSRSSISNNWKSFIDYHTSQSFYKEVLSLFENHIDSVLPNLEKTLGFQLTDAKIRLRKFEGCAQPGEGIMDCQFVHTTPVEPNCKPSSAKPHTDRETAFFAGLLYMRDPDDQSSGGDLELYEFTDQPNYRQKKEVGYKGVKCVKKVPYKANTMALFLHHPNAVHGVSPRSITPHPRNYINFLCEFDRRIFDFNSVAKKRKFYQKKRKDI